MNRMSYRLMRIAAISTTAVIIISGCASVTIRKVPTPSQYMQWTDDMQRKADEMQGIRYYMPRPFINVFESFPIRTDIYLAQGVVSPDGKYIALTDIVPEEQFSSPTDGNKNVGVHLPTVWNGDKDNQGRFTVPVMMVKAPDHNATVASGAQPSNESGGPVAEAGGGGLGQTLAREVLLRVLQGADPPIEFKGTGIDGPTLADILKKFFEEKGKAASRPAPTPLVSKLDAGKPTGINRTQVLNDNSLYAYEPMRGNFDIAYLPDFEEQYVVNGTANLGNANVALVTGQGWSLQGLDAVADNSEITRRIFDLIDTAVQVAKTAAFKGLNFVPGAAVAQGAGGSLTMNPDAQAEWKELAGTPVTLKFVVIHYAAKGVYPVLKPRELQQRYWQTDPKFGYRYGRYFCALDLFKLFPQKTPASMVGLDFSPAPPEEPPYMTDGDGHGRRFSQGKNATLPAELSGHWLNALSGQATIPVYPYQYISFNTFRYVAIEAIQATSSGKGPFEFPYSATGTDDKRGLVREDVKTLEPSSRPTQQSTPDENAIALLVDGDYIVNDTQTGRPLYTFNVKNVTYTRGAALSATVSTISLGAQNVSASAMKDAFETQATAQLRRLGHDTSKLGCQLTVPPELIAAASQPTSNP